MKHDPSTCPVCKNRNTLECPVCHTHWNPKNWERKEVRTGHCPDCGHKGVPIKRSEHKERS